MATTVSAPANHYQLLGLAHDASEAEIEHAFAREISSLKPRAFGGITEISVAYRTLRDPARRRDYDKAIGIERRPTAAAGPLGLHLEMHMKPPARRQDTVGGFIAAALRNAEEPRPEADAGAAKVEEEPRVRQQFLAREPAPQPLRLIEPEPAPAIEPETLAEPIAPMDPWPEERESALEWKRPGLTIAALFVGVAVAGAAAGLWSQREVAAPASATVPLPEPKSAAVAAVPEEAATPAPAPVPAVQQHPAAVPSAVTPRRAGPKPVVQSEAPPAATAQSGEQLAEVEHAPAAAAEVAPDPVAAAPAEPEAPAATAAAMPLPAATVARTIQKIGYPCGRVASSASAGDSGVFIVTCSSGDSYRAAPVHGRYHFKRLGKH